MSEELFEVIRARRSVRKFTQREVPEEVVRKALEAAVLAPNSSNMQTWDFYWVRTPEIKAKLVKACLSQAAARGARELLVVVADPTLWRRANPEMIQFISGLRAKGLNIHPVIKSYYERLIPLTYSWGPLGVFGYLKALAAWLLGWFKVVERGPFTPAELKLVAVKSAALAAENFVLAIQAQGFDTCMMEGYDEVRVKRLLRLGRHARVTMVIAVGEADPQKGTWGPRFRLPIDNVVHRV